MALNGAFQPQGLTISLTSNAAGGTSNSALITTTTIGASYTPIQFRIVPAVGNADVIWISLTQTLTPVVIPTAGVASPSPGVPQQALPLYPGVIELFTFGQWFANVNNLQQSGFYLNFISLTASQGFSLTPGEGI